MITLLALLLAAIAVVRSACGPAITPRWPTIVVGTLLVALAAVAAPEAIVLKKAIGRAFLPMGLLWLFFWPAWCFVPGAATPVALGGWEPLRSRSRSLATSRWANC